MTKLSIVIPVYNVEYYIAQCLESILNQSFKDLEIICVNDGSTDNSLSVLQDYKAKDDRIIIIDQKNEGSGVARNAGLSIAKGIVEAHKGKIRAEISDVGMLRVVATIPDWLTLRFERDILLFLKNFVGHKKAGKR